MTYYSLSRPPDGRIMCCICFSYLWPGECFLDLDGSRWDICPGQCARESGMTHDLKVITCFPTDAQQYPPHLRAAWHNALRDMEQRGIALPPRFIDSTETECTSCHVTVRIGPRQREVKAEQPDCAVLCIVCTAILNGQAGLPATYVVLGNTNVEGS